MAREIEFREALREAMSEEMRTDPRVFLMGEEVAEYHGAYKVSKGMLEEFDPETTCVDDGNWFWLLLLFLPLAIYLLWRPLSLLAAKYSDNGPGGVVAAPGVQDGLVPPPPPEMRGRISRRMRSASEPDPSPMLTTWSRRPGS